MRTSPWSVTGLVSKALKGQKGLSGETSVGYTPSLSRVFQSTSYGTSGTPEVGQLTPQHGNAYDAAGQYADTTPEYQAPDAWFDGASERTPQPLLGPLNGLAASPEFVDPQLTQPLLQQGADFTMGMVREVVTETLRSAYGIDPDRLDNDALYEASILSQEALADAMEQTMTTDMAQAVYDQMGAMSDPLAANDALEEEAPEFDATPSGAAEFGLEQGLEQVVEDSFDEPMGGPLEMIVDDAMAEPDMMQDEQMMQMMDPFMMPGPFGPGPAL